MNMKNLYWNSTVIEYLSEKGRFLAEQGQIKHVAESRLQSY